MNAITQMVLQNIRVRGLGDVLDSKWFEVGKSISFLHVPQTFNSRGFLEAIESINPPYDIVENLPFANYPTIYRQGRIQKRVRPHRRTIALTIFIAQPDMVKRLAAISQDLYEVDRIEIGRRMNYSRWVNFVELASSSRWSEVQAQIGRLKKSLSKVTSTELTKVEQLFKDTDRLINGRKDLFLKSLEAVEIVNGDQNVQEIKTFLRNKALRQDFFSEAKQKVREVLPLFQCYSYKDMQSGNDESQGIVDIVINKIEDKLRICSPAVFLLDLTHPAITSDNLSVLSNYCCGKRDFAQFVVTIPEKVLSMNAKGTHITLDDLQG